MNYASYAYHKPLVRSDRQIPTRLRHRNELILYVQFDDDNWQGSK